MKQLTKEECLEALKGLIYKSEVNETEWLEDKQCWLVKDAYQRKIGLLFQLINEHFELKGKYKTLVLRYDSLLEEYGKLRWNPPLKFEELEVGMWVWDNKWKTYYTIGKFRNKNIYARYVRFVVDPYTDEQKVDNNGWMGVFEENRFYRYEVKDNAF